jgi:uncharacterized protein
MAVNIGKLESFVRNHMQGDASGHDWFHADRVRKTACGLARSEGCQDLDVVIVAALLHDVADRKLHPDPTAAKQEIRAILVESGFNATQLEHVMEITEGVSYRGAGVRTPMRTLEGQVVQDADRLDAMGAIGIARCFAYGGRKGRPMYDPSRPPVLHSDAESYHGDDGPSLNHFFEKLLLLRDRMQTGSAKKAATQRHRFLEDFVREFLSEWDSQDLQG